MAPQSHPTGPVIDLSLGVAALEREDLVEGQLSKARVSPQRGPQSRRGEVGASCFALCEALCPGRCRGVWGLQPGLALARLVLVPLPVVL